jgi:hypothetical protein
MSFAFGLVATLCLIGVIYLSSQDKPVLTIIAFLAGLALVATLNFRYDIKAIWFIIALVLFTATAVMSYFLGNDWENIDFDKPTYLQVFFVLGTALLFMAWAITQIGISTLNPLKAFATQPLVLPSWLIEVFNRAYFILNGPSRLAFFISAAILILSFIPLVLFAKLVPVRRVLGRIVVVSALVWFGTMLMPTKVNAQNLNPVIPPTEVAVVATDAPVEATYPPPATFTATTVVIIPTNTPIPAATPIPPTVTPIPPTPMPIVINPLDINVYVSDSGEVMLNHDDGDSTMGTTLNIDIVGVDGVNITVLIPPMFSADVECEKCEMIFYTDHYESDADIDQAVAFANAMYPATEYRIWAGEEIDTPEGWTHIDSATFSWGTIKGWKYSAVAIQPPELYTNPEGSFVSVDQGEREFTTTDSVLYGQFWKPGTDGEIWHFQVTEDSCVKIPTGYQGKFWTWYGDFSLGMEDLQRRMIQATASEVVDRDDIKKVNLLLFGTLPPINPEYMSFQFNEETITWTTPPTDSMWICGE